MNEETRRTLLTAPVVMTGERGRVLRPGSVLVERDRIVAVGSPGDVEQRIDALPSCQPVARHAFSDATILPGLIDAHVHLAFGGAASGGRLGGVSALQAEDDDERLVLSMAERAATLLDRGVTTVRDLGDRGGLSLRVRDAVATGKLPGPRVLAATTPLTPPGGHCHYLGGAVEGERAIRERVDRLAANGADVVKIMASGGENTPGAYAMWDPQFTALELRAAVDQAHAHGLRVAAHAHAADGVEAAVDAGVDTVEHATWLTAGPNWDPRPDVARRMAETGVVLCHGSSNDWHGLARVLGEDWAWRMTDRIAWFAELGVSQICGTDAGINDFSGTPSALARFADHGFAPDHLVEIGTRAGAAALGLAGETGTLRTGLCADVLVVDGDVTRDVRALKRTRLILARGVARFPRTQERQ